MKYQLQQLLSEALDKLGELGELSTARDDIVIQLEKTRDSKHGDYASNIAMVLAKEAGCSPRELAEKIRRNIPESVLLERIEIAGPGFINFFLSKEAYTSVINDILDHGDAFGASDFGQKQAVIIEFVSANPTGPLHIGHGRGAAYGAAVANMLETIGYEITREYYVNDAGRQIDILVASVWLRYLQSAGIKIELPEKAYQGEYIRIIAENIYKEKGGLYVLNGVENELASYQGYDEEKKLDSLITYTRDSLGDKNYSFIQNYTLNKILDNIRNDLLDFGVKFDNWFSECSLIANDHVKHCIRQLEERGFLYEKEGALWFRSSDFGDEKDRVVVRDNGQVTYFASDIAYHKSKLERGYLKAIDVWGADHHGYIARVKAALAALGEDPENLDILLVQFASLYRGNEKIQMSTRAGQYVTLRELQEEVGKDAARFFYVTRKCEQHLDFDLELAKSQSSDNPVYYIQYAHARICSVFEQMKKKGYKFVPKPGNADLTLLRDQHEKAILVRLADYPAIVHSAAVNYEPHQIGYYLRELANEFHTYYNARQFLVESEQLRNARISLIQAVRQVIRNGLGLLDVSAPDSM